MCPSLFEMEGSRLVGFPILDRWFGDASPGPACFASFFAVEMPLKGNRESLQSFLLGVVEFKVGVDDPIFSSCLSGTRQG